MKRVFLSGLVMLCAVLPAAEESTIRFEDIAQKTGILFTSDSSPTPNKNQPETMVGGVALFDYDNDGYLDVYFVNGAAIPSLKKESPRYWNRLYHNNRDGTFTDVTDKAHLSGGVLDGKKMWSIGAGWFDFNNDGHLDLFVSNYCKWEVNKDPVCGPPGMRAYCHPKNYQALPNTLYRNNSDGTFTDVSAQMGVSKSYGKGMGIVFADYDHDGFMDVFVANDNAPNQLFHNLGGKSFEEVALQAGVAYPESGAFISGLGADFKDIDNDGYECLWHTAIEG